MATIFSKYSFPFSRFKTGRKKPAKKSAAENECSTSFKEQQQQEKAFESVARGTCMVELDRIVGSVGRYHDFDDRFRTGTSDKDERLQHILTAMRANKKMPPISLYQIKDNYYIMDGHHRVQAARIMGYGAIRANIVELLPSRDTLDNRIYLEKLRFREESCLAQSIELTEPGQYSHLEKQIREHQDYLGQETGEEVSYQDAAKDWYTTIYKPLTAIIEETGLLASFPERTLDDLYLYISLYHWEKGKQRTYDDDFDQLVSKNMEQFRMDMMQYRKQNYPDMRRHIIFFILLIVDGRQEQKIVDKLYALKEVREVHVVHGSIDLLTKVVLERDLLSSDAEQLSQFIMNTVRRWNGVISTQTLIPGESRVKGEVVRPEPENK